MRMELPKRPKPKSNLAVVKNAVMEFFLMMMFVFIGCGCAVVLTEIWPMLLKKNSAIENEKAGINVTDVVQADYHSFLSFNAILPISLCFGFAITALVYMSAHISGGQINCCVTAALAVVGELTWIEAGANTLAQTLGSVLGAALVDGMVPYGEESALGSNSIAHGIGIWETFLGEMLMTALLIFCVLECVVNKASKCGNNAPLVIGLVVVLGHLVLIPMDGCSINPTRSFGPALLSGQWNNFWVFLLAPYVGTGLAVAMHLFFKSEQIWDYEEMPESAFEDPESNSVELNTREKIRLAPSRG